MLWNRRPKQQFLTLTEGWWCILKPTNNVVLEIKCSLSLCPSLELPWTTLSVRIADFKKLASPMWVVVANTFLKGQEDEGQRSGRPGRFFTWSWFQAHLSVEDGFKHICQWTWAADEIETGPQFDRPTPSNSPLGTKLPPLSISHQRW